MKMAVIFFLVGTFVSADDTTCVDGQCNAEEDAQVLDAQVLLQSRVVVDEIHSDADTDVQAIGTGNSPANGKGKEHGAGGEEEQIEKAEQPDTDEENLDATSNNGICYYNSLARKARKRFIKLDTNKDNKLSAEELHAHAEGDSNAQDFSIDVTQFLEQSLPSPVTFCSSQMSKKQCDVVTDACRKIIGGVEPSKKICPSTKQALEEALEEADEDAERQVDVLEEGEEDGDTIEGEEEDTWVKGQFGKQAKSSLVEVNMTGGKLSSKNQKAANKLAFASTMKAINKLLLADYCHQDVWARGAHERECKGGWSRGSGFQGLLCLPDCNSGYGRFGEFCNEQCSSKSPGRRRGQWRDHWASWCAYDYDSTCSIFGFSWDCTKTHVEGKGSYHSMSCALADTSCTRCPSGTNAEGGFCYEPRDGYTCTPASLTCTWSCKGHLSHNCAAACAEDGDSCHSNIIEQVAGVTEAVISTATLALSLGVAAPAAVFSATTKSALKQAAKKSARRVAIRVSKQVFKDELKKVRKEIIRKAVYETFRDNLVGKVAELFVASADKSSDELADAYIQKAEDNADSTAEAVIEDIDPTGIVKAIDGSVDNDAGHVQASNWLAVFGTVDPTGILAAVSTIMKHPHCEALYAKEKEIVDPEVDLDVDVAPQAFDNMVLSSGAIHTLWDPKMVGTWLYYSRLNGKGVYLKGGTHCIWMMYFNSVSTQWNIAAHLGQETPCRDHCDNKNDCPNGFLMASVVKGMDYPSQTTNDEWLMKGDGGGAALGWETNSHLTISMEQ